MKEIWGKIWNWVNHNRWSIIAPLIGILIWTLAVGCTPTAISPISGNEVTAPELQNELDVYLMQHEITLKKFDMAADEIQRQIEDMEKIKTVLLALASGSVADWPGLLQLLISGGAIGVVLDNIRKGAVIGGMKRAMKNA